MSPLIGQALGDLYSKYFYFDPTMQEWVTFCSIVASLVFYTEFKTKKDR